MKRPVVLLLCLLPLKLEIYSETKLTPDQLRFRRFSMSHDQKERARLRDEILKGNRKEKYYWLAATMVEPNPSRQLKLLKKAAKYDPRYAYTMLYRAEILVRLKQPKAAISVLNKAASGTFETRLLKESLLLDIHGLRAFCHYRTGDFRRAALDYEKTVDNDPSYDAMIQYSRSLYKLRQYPKSHEIARRAKNIAKRRIGAYVATARADIRMGKHKEAAAHMERAQILDDENSNYLTVMAELSAETGDFDQAREFIRAYGKKERRGMHARVLMARIEAKAGNRAKAIKLLDSVTPTKPSNAEHLAYLYNNRAWLRAKIGDHDKSVELARKALAKHQHSGFWHTLGYNFLAKGEYKKAIKAFSKAIRLNEHAIHAFTDRGHAWIALKKKKKACKDFTRAVELLDYEAKAPFEKHCNK